MRTDGPRRKLEWVLRLGLAGVLAFAGWQKLLEPHVFAEQVANYQWLPETALWVAAFLPPIELVTALGLLLPAPWRKGAALLATAMFALFFVAVARAYALEIDVDCGCFGAGSGAIGPVTLLRNLALTAAAAAAWWLASRETAPSPNTYPS